MSVLTHKEGRVLRVTLNREEHRNLLTREIAHELITAFTTPNDEIGAFLLHGNGTFFCYGGSPSEIPLQLWTLRLNKPVIAAVQGAALGAGLALVCMAHVAVAAQGTNFGLLDIRNKTCPPALDLIAAAIGLRRATELSLTGRTFSALEAQQMGLVQEIAPAFEYEDRAEALAHLLSEADTETVHQILRVK